jgi:hypothetical protein
MAECGWDMAWVGRCKDEATEADGRCQRHTGNACCSCGRPATRECADTFQFVCGAPLCDDCVGANASGGGHHPREARGAEDHRCPETNGLDRCEHWRGHVGEHRIIDGRNAQGSR